MSVDLPLLAFNDVYRVRQRYVQQRGYEGTEQFAEDAEITVAQFCKLASDLREEWLERPDGVKDGLFLFAGDVFSPSVESSVTRGSHMVPLLNAMKVDAACVGYPHLTKLAGDTHFPWLLSNVYDEKTGETPVPLRKYWVTERRGVRIGVIGLVEEDWIATIPSWPHYFRYRNMREVAIELSKELRDPKGEHRVDIIIALTHSRLPNDIKLANELGAVAGADVQNEHGVDLLIGGHDHIYYIGKGATSWEGYVGNRGKPGTEEDLGVRLIKSGTDFRDLSSATLELSPPDDNAIRRRMVTGLTGIHHYIVPSSPTSPEIEDLVKSLLADVTKALSQPVCYTLTPFDARSEVVRTEESALGNWVADVLLHAYDESLAEDTQIQFEKDKNNTISQDVKGADAVIICGGTLRGDSQYGPGLITLGDILEIFPFDDAIVCLELDGKGIWDVLESALSKWPAQEGRFPIVSGLAVKWDHRKPPGKRIDSINITMPMREHEDECERLSFVDNSDGTRIEVQAAKIKLGPPVKNEEGGRKYYIITREYMADGFDGFEAFKGRQFIIDDENGQTMSSIIRSFLLGSSYIFRQKQLQDAHNNYLSAKTINVLKRARAQHHSPNTSLASSPAQAVKQLSSSPESPIRDMSNSPTSTYDLSSSTLSVETSMESWAYARRHVVEHNWVTIREAMHVARNEHMSSIDQCAGDELRQRKAGHQSKRKGSAPIDTPTSKPTMLVDEKRRQELKQLATDVAIVAPQVDGRMRDVAPGGAK